MLTDSTSALFGGRRTGAERRLAAAALCAAVCLAAGALWTAYLLLNLGAPGVTGSMHNLRVLLYALPAAAAGMLAHAHRPGSPVGWVLLGYALALIVPRAVSAPLWLGAIDPLGPVGPAVTGLMMVGYLISGTLWYSLPLWFPDGRLPNRWWRLYVWGIALWMVPQVAAGMGQPERYGVPNPLADGWWGELSVRLADALGSLPAVSHVIFILIGSAVLLARARSGDRRRWRHAALLLTAYLLWAGAQQLVYYRGETPLTVWTTTTASILLTAGVAHVVVRTGTWRMDRTARWILSKLLVATGLTTVFLAVMAALAAGTEAGRATRTLLLVALAFLLGAALRRITARATGVVDRLYYGERAHPYQVLRTLAERISRTVDPRRVPATLCSTVVETLRLPGAELALRTRAGPRVVARAGRDGGPRQRFDLRQHGEVIGHLAVSPRDGGTTLDELDAAIVSSLADQTAPALASLVLQEDLRASREQIVTAREAERRRLRRDIHDGLGPALAGLRLRVDNATALLPEREEGVRSALDTVSHDLGAAIGEVRRITEQLGPAPLEELGLDGALHQLAAAFTAPGLTVTADLAPPEGRPPSGRLPAAVEVAAYRIAAEALTNVVRHARARRARLRMRATGHALDLVIEDDGRGPGPPARPDGLGVRSMAERAAEIGGRCTVTPRPGGGTRVHAVLPLSPLRSAPPPDDAAADGDGTADTAADGAAADGAAPDDTAPRVRGPGPVRPVEPGAG